MPVVEVARGFCVDDVARGQPRMPMRRLEILWKNDCISEEPSGSLGDGLARPR